MEFGTSRASAVEKLNKFVDKNLFKKFYGEPIGKDGWNFDLEYGMTT